MGGEGTRLGELVTHSLDTYFDPSKTLALSEVLNCPMAQPRPYPGEPQRTKGGPAQAEQRGAGVPGGVGKEVGKDFTKGSAFQS